MYSDFVVRIDFGPLMELHHVLDRKRMNRKHLGDRPELFLAAKAHDIDPQTGHFPRNALSSCASSIFCSTTFSRS